MTRYYTSITYEFTQTGVEIVSLFPVDYSGAFDLMKGDTTDQNAENAQASFDNQLTQIFTAQYQKQSAITNYLTNLVTPQITAGGQGYSGADLAAARTAATDTLSTQYQNAQRSVNAGESKALPSGVNAQVSGDLAASEASAQAGAQNNITQQNEQLKQQNYWNSINVLNGAAATENPLGYASASTSGNNAVANLSQAYTSSNQSQLLGALGGIVGGAASGFGAYEAAH